MQSIPFLNDDQVREIQSTYGTPVYVYDQATLESQAEQDLAAFEELDYLLHGLVGLWGVVRHTGSKHSMIIAVTST